MTKIKFTKEQCENHKLMRVKTMKQEKTETSQGTEKPETDIANLLDKLSKLD